MKYICFILLVGLCCNCSGQHKIAQATCFQKSTFLTDFDSLFSKVDSVADIFDYSLKDKGGNRFILEAYGFRTSIKKVSECEYSFYLTTFISSDILALKYDLKLYTDNYTLRLDSLFNPYLGYNDFDITELNQEVKLKKSLLNQGEYPECTKLYLSLFRASMVGDEDALELFESFRVDQQAVSQSHDYHALERILVDHGFIKHKLSTAKEPSVFNRKYSY